MAREKQEELPELKIEGENDKPIKRITEKAEEYDRAKKSRMRALIKEVLLKEELMQMLHDEDIQVYRDDDLIVVLTSKENLKVKHETDEPKEEDEE